MEGALRARLLLLLAVLVAFPSQRGAVHSPAYAGEEDVNAVPIPAQPLTSADPFNPAEGGAWTNDEQPPPRDEHGRFIYLPSVTVAYSSFFTLSGRSCGYLYVDAAESLPRPGARIRLSADKSVSYMVVQTKTKGRPVIGRGLTAGRVYAYICSHDGQYHRLSGGAGKWTYDVWRQAETGLPMYVDTGVVAAPHFIEIPRASAVHAAESDPCADRSDWRSLDHKLSCRDYRDGGRDRLWCTDTGYYDPSILNPLDTTGKIEWDVPAYVACPEACRMCVTCKVNMTTVDMGRLASVRSQEIVLNGCMVGYDCVDLKGAPLMEDGQLVKTEFELIQEENPQATRNYIPIPDLKLIDPQLITYFKQLRYYCRYSPRKDPPVATERNLVDLEPGVEFDTSFLFRVFSATPNSLVRYTLDGSEPRYDHGRLVMPGGVIELRQSAQVKAMAYLDPATHIAIKHSRTVTLPFIGIRIGSPVLEVSTVGHYRRAWAQVQAECTSSSGFVSSLIYNGYEYVRSNGCPRFEWATPNVLNVARHQAWHIPIRLQPTFAFTPITVSHVGGMIGIARNGVPIFAPPPSVEEPGFAREMLEVDACNGLALSVRQRCEDGQCLFDTDHHGQYHYRMAPTCLDNMDEADGHSGIIGMMLDGIPIYGVRDIGGAPPLNLDACRGHTDAGRPWYHYHASAEFPYTVGCLSGCLDSQTVQPVNPALAVEADECAPAVEQPGAAQGVRRGAWIDQPAASETALLLSGNYTGSVSIQVTCPMHPGGLAFLRFTTNGEDPVVGGAPGQGFALGTMRIIVAEMASVRARCEAPHMLPSEVVTTEDIYVRRVAYNPHWAATTGFWNLTDAATFVRSYSAPRAIIQGGCPELKATHISPAYVSDLSTGIGDLMLMPPDCKAGRPDWDVDNQPSLASIYGLHRGISGVLLGNNIAVNGLQVREAGLRDLLAARKLPQEQLTVEVWAAMMAGTEGALAGVIFKASGFLGKGWYLGWESDTSSAMSVLHTVTFTLTLSTQASDNFGRGGLATVRATVPKLQVGQNWVHVAGTYDGKHLALYLNGTLAATERACRRDYCGQITYPELDGVYVLSDLHFAVGALEFQGRQIRHQGYIGMVRVMGEAVSEQALRAGAQRLTLPLSLSWCPPGTYGPYDGLRPCVPCEVGLQAPLGGQTRCEPCTAGYYSDVPGSDNCKQCPGGVLTAGEGSSSVDNCTGPDYCKSLLHDCHAFAECTSTAGSFECTCLPGFSGDGTVCKADCGDGVTVFGETCDDGNNRSADGCSSSCTIEQGFSCSAQPGKPDLCVCEMDAAECCVRRYGSCMAVTPESCSATCFDNLTVCLRDAQSAPRASPDTIVDASAAEVGASAAETTEGVEALNLTQWAQAEPLQCNRTAMKRCREEFAGCQNTVSQQQQLLQQGSVAASAALLPNSAGIGAGGEGGCSAASCLQRFVRCMRITACPDYTKIVADGMA